MDRYNEDNLGRVCKYVHTQVVPFLKWNLRKSDGNFHLLYSDLFRSLENRPLFNGRK